MVERDRQVGEVANARAMLSPVPSAEIGNNRRVDVEHIALTPRCEECGDVWLPADEER